MKSRSLIRYAVLFWVLGIALMTLLVLCFQDKTRQAARTVREANYKPVERMAASLPQLAATPRPFDDDATYVLSAWSRFGVYQTTGSDLFTFGETGGGTGPVLEAQLIRRGLSPEQVLEDATLTWRLQDESNADLDPQRMDGNADRTGTLTISPDGKFYQSEAIAVQPYTQAGKFMPYPVVLVEARGQDGAVLAATQTVLPVSSELGCKNCHTGAWKDDNKAGIADATAMDILKVHDRINKTSLLEDAKSGPVDCSTCHSGMIESIPALSAALHGWHANYMSGRGADACTSCHPADPMGSTRFYRGRHVQAGLTCVSCHGHLEDHATALLLNERTNAPAAAKKLMKNLDTVAMPFTDITPRKPWVNQPDCTACHNFTTKPIPAEASAFNHWAGDGMRDAHGDPLPLFTQRYDLPEATRCQACHGSPHALYPAVNPYGPERDALVPLQYQQTNWVMGSSAAHGPSNCQTCHLDPMEVSIHHEIIVPEEN